MALFKPDDKPIDSSSVAAVADAGPQIGKTAGKSKPRGLSLTGIIDGFLSLLSAVPFGIFLLVLLISACMTGMLIQQVELETFPRYFDNLTPAERLVYGQLGFFDIYHVWYFNLLLLLLSLNIILASIDHFPKAWNFVRRKKLTASPTFAMTQRTREQVNVPGVSRSELVRRAQDAAREMKFRIKTTDEPERTTVFAERGAWNRLGAYAVHIGLLTIFAGGFLTSRGHTGLLWLEPGETSDRMSKQVFNFEGSSSQLAVGTQELELPFSVHALDLQQKLINNQGSIETSNTLDWLTAVRLKDEETGEERDALIHMNKPYDFRGYRFFQTSVATVGSARTVKLRATPESGGPAEDVEIRRNGETRLADGTRIAYRDFNPDFRIGQDRKVGTGPGTTTYERPAVHLQVIKPDGQSSDPWAFTDAFNQEIAGAPFMQSISNGAGYRFSLLEFEKVPRAHAISIQYDPGVRVVYVGFTMLCLTLIGVFFFSHQRLWIVAEDGRVSLGGDSNRNRLGFEDRVKKIAARVHNPAAANAEQIDDNS